MSLQTRHGKMPQGGKHKPPARLVVMIVRYAPRLSGYDPILFLHTGFLNAAIGISETKKSTRRYSKTAKADAPTNASQARADAHNACFLFKRARLKRLRPPRDAEISATYFTAESFAVLGLPPISARCQGKPMRAQQYPYRRNGV